MSKNDKIKEQQEANAFLEAYLICQNNNNTHIITRNIMESIIGESVAREKKDSPDLLFHRIKEDDEYYVGVEVFTVDQNSVKKGKMYESKSEKNKSNLAKVYTELCKQMETKGEATEEIKAANLNATFDLAKGNVNSGYKNFIDAFRYNFNKHARKIPKYRNNVAFASNGHDIKLAFFIEVEAVINDWYYNPANNKPFEKVDNMPFFKKMLSIIKCSDNIETLDYIIFYMHDPLKKYKQVFAVDVQNIESQLDEQNIIVWHYAGEQIVSEKIGGTAQDWSVVSKPGSSISRDILPLYFNAVQLKEENQPFVTSRKIQHLLFICPYAKTEIDFCHHLRILGPKNFHRLSKEFTSICNRFNSVK